MMATLRTGANKHRTLIGADAQHRQQLRAVAR